MKSPPSTLTTAGKEVADAGALLKVFSGNLTRYQLLVVPKTRDVCNGSKADITARSRHVRSPPQSRHSTTGVARPLCAMSGSHDTNCILIRAIRFHPHMASAGWQKPSEHGGRNQEFGDLPD